VAGELTELPFDQYQRYRLVADLLAARPAGPPAHVLEVGGGVESRLADFLPGARVVIADVELGAPSSPVAYVAADARARLPFTDASFDAAVSIDMLEHLAPETRPTVVAELRRVATGPVVVACPVASTEAVAAELAIATCYRAVFGTEHRWLAEHLANGLPAPEDIDALVDGLGGAWRRYDNGYLPEWQALMLVHLLFDEMPGGALAVREVRTLDALYNSKLYAFANRAPAYRAAWVHVPSHTELPAFEGRAAAAAPGADRAAFEAAFRAACTLLPGRERLLADVERLQKNLAATVEDRAKVVADRDLVERLRYEARAEAAALRTRYDAMAARAAALDSEYRVAIEDRDRLAVAEHAWEAESAYLQRRCRALTAERDWLAGEREALRVQIAELRWRLGRLWPLDRVADAIAPVVRPVVAPLRRPKARPAPPPPEPYGPDVQARLTASRNGSGPASVPVTIVVRDEGVVSDAVERTRRSIAAQTARPAEIRDDVPPAPGGTHVIFLLAGDRLASNALAEIGTVLEAYPSATVIYADEDEWTPDGGRSNPELKPDWDPELARSAGYLGSLACFRADLLARVPRGLSTADLRYALGLAVAEEDESLARHVPRILCHADPANRARQRFDPASATTRALLAAHLDRVGDPGDVLPAPPGLRIRRPVDPATRASIIIPYRDGPDLTARCLETLLARNRHPSWEIIFVDNGSVDPRAEAIVQGLVAAHPGRVQVIRYPLPYNFSAMNNVAAARATGDILVLVNNDTEVLTDDWLEHLISLASRPAAGAVGALLFFPDGTIQHCGIVLGMGSWPGRSTGVAGQVMRGCRAEEVDPLLWAYDRRAGAVTAAFVAVRRDRYLAVGGLDETLRNDFNDVDLCLKLEARGFRTLYTPHVRVTHHESVTRAYRALDPGEVEQMFDRWADRFAVDPHVSPHLDRTTLKPALALRPVRAT
jgi:GT2 family glycosyltransferase